MKILKSNSLLAILLVLVVVLVACNSSATQLDMVNDLPLYKGAYDVDKRTIGTGANQQLSYKIQDEYPSRKVLDFYANHLENQGWVKCTGTMESWSAFVDAAHSEDLLVHHTTYYWVKRSVDRLAIVFLRYNSKWPNKSKIPDNKIQNVFVLMQKEISDLRSELSRLSVKCP